ncbi:hypothetical protein Glove_362g44 [Diversispora epigaea]|nr:hypothetical protein Glove_362g44 [Diversispora epigaea]
MKLSSFILLIVALVATTSALPLSAQPKQVQCIDSDHIQYDGGMPFLCAPPTKCHVNNVPVETITT